MSKAKNAISLRHEILDLHLRHTFATARDAEDVAHSVLLRLTSDGFEALGESAPSARYGETPDLIERQLDRVNLEGADPWRIDAVLGRLPHDARGTMCALDIALHDLAALRIGVPLHQLLGLDPAHAKPTSFTIGLADLGVMLDKVREARELPILKIKLAAGREVEIIEAVRDIFTGAIRIDANEAWDPEHAVGVLRELARFDIELCEQPIKAGQVHWLRYVRELSPIPIFVDEDCRTLSDLAPLMGYVDGINIKLVKSGGIREAIRMIHAARAMNLKIMLGCMIESSVLATAAAHLTPLVDYADLDGPLLISDDPFTGVRFDGARLILPTEPGLGIKASRREKIHA